jgi:Cu(I)/Ag(I) efflux system periplasmic protein CusF
MTSYGRFSMNKPIPFTALLTALVALPAGAADQSAAPGIMMEDGSMGSGDMMHGETSAGATGLGVINRVEPDKGVVNISHGPIPALSWPEMTMDLPVAEGVDLGSIQPGDEVRFRILLGDDQVYRITALDKTP